MELKITKQQLYTVGLLIIIIILLWRGCNQQNQLKEQIGLYEAATDTLTKTKTKLGEEITKTELLVADNEKDLLKLQSQDSTIMQLQGVVKDYKGKLAGASVLGNSTTNIGTTETITIHDTIVVNGVKTLSPIYKTDWKERWSEGSIVATRDSISRTFKVRNEFEITQGWEKQGFLKGKKAIVSIKNLNPNTVTEELKSFTVQEQKKRVSLGVGAMYGFDIIGLKPTIVIGAGVQYTLLKF